MNFKKKNWRNMLFHESHWHFDAPSRQLEATNSFFFGSENKI